MMPFLRTVIAVDAKRRRIIWRLDMSEGVYQLEIAHGRKPVWNQLSLYTPITTKLVLVNIIFFWLHYFIEVVCGTKGFPLHNR